MYIRLKKLECMENISITASTGMARLQFVNGQTIHSWSGYGNGQTDLNTLKEFNLMDPTKNVKLNILKCDCLVIDEICIISQKIFETVEFICRTTCSLVAYKL